MDALTLQPIAKIEGEINLPGSKSLSNRALLLAALANGETEIVNLLDSDDIRHMLNALQRLGVAYTRSTDGTRCTVMGKGGPFNIDGAVELYLGNAGTAMRPLRAALCLGRGEFTLTGEPRMEERPIGALVDSLREPPDGQGLLPAGATRTGDLFESNAFQHVQLIEESRF